MSTEEKSNFSERLKDLRFAMRLTQDEMGERLNVDGNYIYMLEKGDKRPGPKLLTRFEELEQKLEKKSHPLLTESVVPYGVSHHTLVARSPLARRIVEHFAAFLDACGDDPAHLGWTLVELQSRFPLDKWSRPQIGGVSSETAAAAVEGRGRAGALAEREFQEAEQKRRAALPTGSKPEPKRGGGPESK